jgi:hypothetical protein
MKNRWIRLGTAITLLSAAFAAAAPRRPFSHKYHLTQVTACENCHTQAEKSSSAADNLLPDKSACVTCHDEVDIMEPRRIGVETFNHAVHVKAGNPAPAIAAAIAARQYLGAEPPSPAQLETKVTCAGCHHGIPESEVVPRDRVVKAHFPQMADCLVCHTEIKPPESCRKCHGVAQTLKPTSHVAGYGDAHAEKTVPKTGCAVCHGRKITCGECH